jgi:hypothetical protein
MTALAIIAGLQIALVAFLIWERHRRDDRLLATIDRLARRIQAPQLAAVELHNEESGIDPQYAPPAIEPDDDDAFWDSREKLAERLMAMERDGD